MSEVTTQFSTGAQRSADANALRFDLIHPVAMLRLAETYAEGALKYGGENWERGMPVHDLLNHLLTHVYLFLAGDRSEPHLAHAAWGAMAAIVSHELTPELNEGHLRDPGCVLGPDIIERLDEFKAAKEAAIAAGTWMTIGPQDSGYVGRIKRQRAEAVEAALDEQIASLQADEPVPTREIAEGDTVLVLRNTWDAPKPTNENLLLEPGDLIQAYRVSKSSKSVAYRAVSGIHYHLPIEDVQLMETR